MQKTDYRMLGLVLAAIFLIFSFSVFSQSKAKISKEEFMEEAGSSARSFPYLKNVSLPLSFSPAEEPSRPVYKDIALKINSTKS
ncbi:MAG: hypothetical protein N2445_05505, partial [Acidobacteria bacterium]|nr:hypothetical protein [Acidobacteriota bacterium]